MVLLHYLTVLLLFLGLFVWFILVVPVFFHWLVIFHCNWFRQFYKQRYWNLWFGFWLWLVHKWGFIILFGFWFSLLLICLVFSPFFSHLKGTTSFVALWFCLWSRYGFANMLQSPFSYCFTFVHTLVCVVYLYGSSSYWWLSIIAADPIGYRDMESMIWLLIVIGA